MQSYEEGRNNQCMNNLLRLHVADLCSPMIILRIELYQITKHQHFKYSKEEPGSHQL